MKRYIFSFIFLVFLSNYILGQRNSFDGVLGGVWPDNSGKPIQAHGGQVQKIGDKWWWIGEDKTDGYRTLNGISLYSSDDLYNWDFEGYVMRAIRNRAEMDTDPELINLYGELSEAGKDSVYLAINTTTSVIERPKLIHNKKTGKYILWFHADGPTPEAPGSGYAAAAAGVAIADNITGPYKYITRSRLHQLPEEEYSQPNEWYEAPNNRGFARDMNLFIDDDETAYIIYSSEENRTMFISRLNEEYTAMDVPQYPVGLAKNGVDFVRLHPGRQREAPAMFKYNGKYYMITSGATGWDPNRAEYWVADEVLGDWQVMGDPFISEAGIPHPASLTFRTQSTNVIPYDPENGKFIYMGDRWNKENLSDSRYVWLPIHFTVNGELQVRSVEEWDLSYFDDINNIRYTTELELDEVYTDLNELPKQLTVEIQKNGSWVEEPFEIIWEDKVIEELPVAAPTKISGSFEYKGITYNVETKIVHIPDDLVYYIDCAADESAMFQLITSKNKTAQLINKDVWDAPFSTERGWGYTGIVGDDSNTADINYKNPESKDAFVSGWFAWYDKPIDYMLKVENDKTYYLNLGFNEWWSTNRRMKTTLSYEDNSGNMIDQVLGEFSNNSQSVQQYKFTIDDLNLTEPYINISVSKTSGADPILSWLALSFTGNVTSVEQDKQDKNKLTVYPNPVQAGQSFNVEGNNNSVSNKNINIFDSSGRLIKQACVAGNISILNAPSSPGLYIVNVGREFVKLIVK